MRLSRSAVILVAAAWLGPGAADAQGNANELRAGFELTVAPDGSVVRVVPQPTLPDALAKAMVKAISAWKFEPPMWHGAPVSFTYPQVLRIRTIPTATGGVALRIAGLSPPWSGEFGVRNMPPPYPQAQNRGRVAGRFAYVLRVATDGSVRSVRRIWPEEPLDRGGKALDAASQASVGEWRLAPYVVDGAPVECDSRTVTVFTPVGDTPDLSPLPPPQPLQDACPAVTVVTAIEGKLL